MSSPNLEEHRRRQCCSNLWGTPWLPQTRGTSSKFCLLSMRTVFRVGSAGTSLCCGCVHWQRCYVSQYAQSLWTRLFSLGNLYNHMAAAHQRWEWRSEQESQGLEDSWWESRGRSGWRTRSRGQVCSKVSDKLESTIYPWRKVLRQVGHQWGSILRKWWS